eukprot:g63285.t1
MESSAFLTLRVFQTTNRTNSSLGLVPSPWCTCVPKCKARAVQLADPLFSFVASCPSAEALPEDLCSASVLFHAWVCVFF